MAEKVETNKMNPSLEQRTESLFTTSMKASSDKSLKSEIHSNKKRDLKWAGIIDPSIYHSSCGLFERVKMGRTQS